MAATAEGGYTWFYWLIDPAVSPDGKTVALFSDAPDPTRSDVVLQLYNVATKKLTKPTLAENPPYGHQDAAWRPDGKILLYVQNGRDGQRGMPQIYAYNPATKQASALGAPGYMRPSWSPDGRWITVTRQTPEGTDVAILDGRTGAEVLRVTNDGSSWAPVWSPRGDAIAYLHIVGQIVDLKMVGLTGSGPSWTVGPAARRDRVQRPRRELGRQLVHPARPAPGNARAECAGCAEHQPEQPVPVGQAVLVAGYLERLAARSAAVGSVLCLGLDPDPTALPPGFPATVAGIERFCLLLLEAAGPYAAAVKPNLAFFEAFGAPGIAALERIRAAVPSSIPVVADAKRGDIGSTAARQAVALFDVLGADAITASPYVGAEGLAPFLERPDRYVYVLCRTSNPGSDELQGLPVAADADRRAGRTISRAGRPAGRAMGTGRHGRSGRGSDGPDRDGPDPGDRPRPGLPRAGGRRPGRRGRAGPGPRPGRLVAGRRPIRQRTPDQRVAGDRPGRAAGARGRPRRPRRADRPGGPELVDHFGVARAIVEIGADPEEALIRSNQRRLVVDFCRRSEVT